MSGDNEADHGEALCNAVASLLANGTAAGPTPSPVVVSTPQPSLGTGPSGPLRSALFASNADLQHAAMGLRNPIGRSAERLEEAGLLQDALDRVLPMADRLNAGAQRGFFGTRTQEAVIKFQRTAGLAEDGLAGRNTLRALDERLLPLQNPGAQPAPLMPPAAPDVPLAGGIDQIIQIAATSDIARFCWANRGRAPIGYIKGMVLVFGRVYYRVKSNDTVALEMARADKQAPFTDALSHYRDQFHDVGMDNADDGPDTLRHLFVLMLGLGMRESSGSHCEGRDTTNSSSGTAETAEAGLFQTSWNAHTASPLMPQIFQSYSATPNSGFLSVFHEQVACTPADLRTYGSGIGAAFQELSKKCPAFAAEFAAVGMRNIRRHWGPINNRAAEVRPEADAMFRQVQAQVDASGLCPLLE